MPLAGFELAIPASERPQTRALDRAAPAIGHHTYLGQIKQAMKPQSTNTDRHQKNRERIAY